MIHIVDLPITWWRHQINGNIFCVTGPLWGEYTGHRYIPLTKASGLEFGYFLWSAEQTNGWANNRTTANSWRHRAHYDVTVMNLQVVSRPREQSCDCRTACEVILKAMGKINWMLPYWQPHVIKRGPCTWYLRSYYSDITLAWRLRSPPTRLFVLQLAQVDNKET